MYCMLFPYSTIENSFLSYFCITIPDYNLRQERTLLETTVSSSSQNKSIMLSTLSSVGTPYMMERPQSIWVARFSHSGKFGFPFGRVYKICTFFVHDYSNSIPALSISKYTNLFTIKLLENASFYTQGTICTSEDKLEKAVFIFSNILNRYM